MIAADTNLGPTVWNEFIAAGSRARGDTHAFLFFDNAWIAFYRERAPHVPGFDASVPLRHYGLGAEEPTDVEERVRQLEEACDVAVMDLVQADRHFGRGLFFLGNRHPRSYLSRRSTYRATMTLIVDLADRIGEVLAEARPDVLVLSGVASLPTKLACVVARSRGVNVRVLAGGRTGNLYYWAEDEFQRTSALQWPPEVSAVRAPEAALPLPRGSGPGDYAATRQVQASFRDNFGLAGLGRRSARILGQEAVLAARKTLLGRDRKLGAYPAGQRLAALLRVYREYRTLRAVSLRDANDVPERYVFLPLHVEPEAALAILSPEFNNQLAVIDQVAKALPPGVFLVVKEHTVGVGRRPVGFYRYLADVANVVVAPLEANGGELARRSQLTVTITGTAGLEASVAGVPVIAFGRHNLYNRLDHVHLGTNFGELRTLVRKLLAMSPEQRAAAERQGRALFEAIKAMCVDLGEYRLTDPAAAALLEDALARSLDRVEQDAQPALEGAVSPTRLKR